MKDVILIPISKARSLDPEGIWPSEHKLPEQQKVEPNTEGGGLKERWPYLQCPSTSTLKYFLSHSFPAPEPPQPSPGSNNIRCRKMRRVL